ncbi:MAG TPA: molybdopterin cofactor-binding domain-containing protein [Geothrix sp.]|nr:molybdopterin cofactor-binding domain-containing protein [Geothrix sp.]
MRRRSFLQSLGATGLVLFFSSDLRGQETVRVAPRPPYPSDFNAYLHIAPDGKVTCFVGKVELGQGAKTALAILLAEELDVALDQVEMIMGDTDRCPWDMGTFGSLSIWQFGPVLRGAGAEARAVLLQLASERLKTPVDQLVVTAGIVSAKAEPARRVSYGELVQGKRLERHLDKVPVKAVAAFQLVGHDAARKDALEKVTGKALYAADFKLPGMRHAKLLRPPAHGAELVSLDTSRAEKVPGAQILKEGALVAVLHERPDGAREASALLKAKWRVPESPLDPANLFEHLAATAPQPQSLAPKGDLTTGEKLSAKILEASYTNAYVAHAPIETHAALASWEGGKVTVRASTQAPFLVRNQVAQACGVAAEKVRIITPYVGGGFGGKSSGPQAVEAARLSKLAGVPILVQWDREEEFFLDSFRPAAVLKLRAGLTREGRISFWDGSVIGAGDREAVPPYAIPHHRTLSAGGWQGGNPKGMQVFDVGPWRAPSANTNVFARESFMDQLALKAGMDPVAFRLLNLEDPRLIRVLKLVAERFGWTQKSAPSGRGMGLACGVYRGTYVAAMTELAVDRGSGQVRVKRISFVQDMGVIVNPDGARQQVEGCLMMGLGYALTEEVPFKGTAILARNFDTYEIPRFSWMPDLDIHLVPNPEVPAQGGGEPPIIIMGALLANAIFDATGARLTHLPMTPARIKAALGKV